MLFESNAQPIVRLHVFVRRMLISFCIAGCLIIFSLSIGMLGFLYYEPMTVNDAFYNGALILSDMGPVQSPTTDGGKIFVGIYALFSGLVFVSIVGVILAPIIHRFLHEFHHHKSHE